MPQRRVKLVSGAVEKAQEMGVNVGFLQDEERYKMEVQDGEATVDGRDFHLLLVHGLIDEDRTQLDSPAADQPEAEAAHEHTRTHTKDRGPSGGLNPRVRGGSGHLVGVKDGYGNDRIQDEIKRDQQRGLAEQKEKGLPSPRDGELEENLRREGRSSKARDEKREAKAEKDQSKTKDQDKAESREKRDAKVKTDDKNDDRS